MATPGRLVASGELLNRRPSGGERAGEGGAGTPAQLLAGRPDVRLDGARAEVEELGDLPVREALRGQFGDLLLAAGQRLPRGSPPGPPGARPALFPGREPGQPGGL